MFKIESYITPLLLSYVEKYVKNLKAEGTQVSQISVVLIVFQQYHPCVFLAL